jgi:hypothetical protein
MVFRILDPLIRDGSRGFLSYFTGSGSFSGGAYIGTGS